MKHYTSLDGEVLIVHHDTESLDEMVNEHSTVAEQRPFARDLYVAHLALSQDDLLNAADKFEEMADYCREAAAEEPE